MKIVLSLVIVFCMALPRQMHAQAIFMYKKRKFAHPAYSASNYKQPDKALAAKERLNADMMSRQYAPEKIRHPFEAENNYKIQRVTNPKRSQRLTISRKPLQTSANPMNSPRNYKHPARQG
jgi:hypothetical protein